MSNNKASGGDSAPPLPARPRSSSRRRSFFSKGSSKSEQSAALHTQQSHEMSALAQAQATILNGKMPKKKFGSTDYGQLKQLLNETQGYAIEIQNCAKVLEHEYSTMLCQRDAIIERLTTDRDHVRRQADDLASINEHKDLFLGEQMQDAVVIQSFNQLFERTKKWATEFGNNEEKAYSVNYDQADVSKIQTILPGLDGMKRFFEVLKIKRTRKRFIRSWIGLVLSSNILRSYTVVNDQPGTSMQSGNDLWLESDVSLAFTRIEEVLTAGTANNVLSLQQLNDWRALTAMLLTKRQLAHASSTQASKDASHGAYLAQHPHVVDLLPGIRSEALKVIEPLLRPDRIDRAVDELDALIISFITFSRDIRRQRASWTIEFEPYSKTGLVELPGKEASGSPGSASRSMEEHVRNSQIAVFDPRQMEDTDATSSEVERNPHYTSGHENNLKQERNSGSSAVLKSVQMRLTPALLKSGDASGRQFEAKSCMMKALVSCLDRTRER